jgi:hypothetical protein
MNFSSGSRNVEKKRVQQRLVADGRYRLIAMKLMSRVSVDLLGVHRYA